MQLNVAATILRFRREDLSVYYFLGIKDPENLLNYIGVFSCGSMPKKDSFIS